MKQKFEEVIVQGYILSKGIAFGKPIFLDSKNVFEENKISQNEIQEEILKFKKAVKQSKNQIIQLKKNLAKDELSITFDILNTYLEILTDPLINNEIETRIERNKKSIENVFNDIISDYKKKIKDPFFQEKILDITGVFKRILSNVRSIKVDIIKKHNFNSIILSNEIIPSDVFEIDGMNISAFLSSSGSYESHAAILARSKNIPFLSKIDVEKLRNISLKEIIVDANNGIVIINPTEKTFEMYKNVKKIAKKQKKSSVKSRVNKKYDFYVNISNEKEMNLILNKNVCGIGLLRTEMYFLGHKEIPSAEIQFQAYKKIAQKLKKRPFVIRLFDLGADKAFYGISNKETSGFFGDRGIKFLLKNKTILGNQIKAILKVSSFGNIYMLIPFVNSIEEILLTKELFYTLQKELNIDPSQKVKIGSMIETPAAALSVNEIIENVDFLSIGTNDLTRYTMASQNIQLNHLPKALEKLIQMVIKASKENNKPLFLCGEMTANQKLLNKLIGFGICNISFGIKHDRNN
jgi:phosphotransferase system enzyme I (PtsI)